MTLLPPAVGAVLSPLQEATQRGGQAVIGRMAGRPWRGQPVARPPRDDVQVEVEDVLPAGGSVRLGEVQSFWRQPLVEEVSDPLRHDHDGGDIALGYLPDVRSVHPGHDQRVALGCLGPVEERDGEIILGNHEGGRVAIDDLAEDAFSWHPDSLQRDASSPRPFETRRRRPKMRTVTSQAGETGQVRACHPVGDRGTFSPGATAERGASDCHATFR